MDLELSFGELCNYESYSCRFCSNIIYSVFSFIFIFVSLIAAAAKSLQSCPTLCDPRDGSPSGSPVLGILQARTLKWVAISFSNEWKWKVKGKLLSRVQLLVTPWTTAYQAPPSHGIFQARVLEWGAIAFSVVCSAICFTILHFASFIIWLTFGDTPRTRTSQLSH